MDELLVHSLLAGIGVILLVYFFLRSSNGASPRALPIIGHLHLLGTFVHHSLMKLAQEYGPCMFLKLGSVPTLVLSSAEAAREALKTHDVTFSSRPVLTTSEIFSYKRAGVLWSPYGEHWRKVRKVCTLELLTSKKIQFFQPVRAEEMSLLMSSLEEFSRRKQVVNLTEMLSDLTYNIMSKMIIGKRFDYSGRFKRETDDAWEYKSLMEESFVAAGDFFIGDYIPWLSWLHFKKIRLVRESHRKMDEYLQKQVDEHRLQSNNRFNDFLSLALQDPELGSSETVIKSVISDVIGGGTDTSAVTVEWALAELIRNPEIMSRVREELDKVVGTGTRVNESDLDKLEYLGAVVKETFRLHPPAPLLIYETTQDCQLKSFKVPGKTRVLINIYAIGRDERSWPCALKFDPQRFIDNKRVDVRGQDFEVLPFGAGRRVCPGIQLGLTMVKFMLASLVHSFNWEMPNGMSYEELDMSEEMGLTVPRATPLNLIPSARLHSDA